MPEKSSGWGYKFVRFKEEKNKITGEESSVHLSLLGVATILGLLGTLQISRKREK